MNETEIKFTTTERKTRLTDGKVCYHGQLLHYRVPSAAETRRYKHMQQQTAKDQNASAENRRIVSFAKVNDSRTCVYFCNPGGGHLETPWRG